MDVTRSGPLNIMNISYITLTLQLLFESQSCIIPSECSLCEISKKLIESVSKVISLCPFCSDPPWQFLMVSISVQRKHLDRKFG